MLMLMPRRPILTLAPAAGVVAAFLLAGGCAVATTSVTSQAVRVPGAQAPARLLCIVLHPDFTLRWQAETALVLELRKVGVVGVRAVDAFFADRPPDEQRMLQLQGRPYSPEETKTVLARYVLPTVLVVSLVNAGSRQSEFTMPSTTTTQIVPVGGTTVYQDGKATTYGGGYSATSTTTPGETLTFDKPFANYRADMFDAKTAKQTWFAQMESRGNAFAGQADLIQNMAKTTVERLRDDGALGER